MLPLLVYMALGAGLVAGLLVTALAIAVARPLGFLDKPNQIVQQHTRPVPHMGGIAIAGATGVVLTCIFAFDSGSASRWLGDRALALAVSAGLFLLLGAADDMLRLSARTKLLSQVLLAIGAAAAGIAYPFTTIPVIDACLSIAWIVVLVNAVNVTDVCDGLVGGLMVVILLCWAHVEVSTALAALVGAGATAGFLAFNVPRAKIFLGDAGSHLLGFLIAGLMLTRPPTTSTALQVGQMALFSAPFLFEMTLLIVVRRRKGLPWWKGSPDHFSLRLQSAGLTRWQVDLIAWSFSLVCCLAAMSLAMVPVANRIAIGAAITCLLWLSWRFLLRHDATPQGTAGENEPQRHVLWIHQNFITTRQAGNPRPVHVISSLLDMGYLVDVLTTQYGYLGDTPVRPHAEVQLEREGRLTIHRLPVIADPSRRTRSTTKFLLEALIYARRIRAVDVVYASTPPLPQVLLAILVSVARSSALVLEVRDLWPAFLTRLGLLTFKPLVWLMEWIESVAYRYADACISVSPAFTDYLASMGMNADRLLTAPSGGHAQLSTASEGARQRWRKRYQLEDRFVVVYAGSFNEYYAIRDLLKAAEMLEQKRPDIAWVFVGNGRLRDEVEAVAARCANTHWIGTVPRDQMPDVYAGADLAFVSLIDEPLFNFVLPGKLVDSLSAGLPIICSVPGLAGWIVEQARAGITIRQSDGEKITTQVCGFADLDPETRRRMGEQGKAWVRRNLPASYMGQVVAKALARARARGRTRPRVLALASAALGAIGDVVTRRGQRVVNRLVRQDLAALAGARFGEWQESTAEEREAFMPTQAGESPSPPFTQRLDGSTAIATARATSESARGGYAREHADI